MTTSSFREIIRDTSYVNRINSESKEKDNGVDSGHHLWDKRGKGE